MKQIVKKTLALLLAVCSLLSVIGCAVAVKEDAQSTSAVEQETEAGTEGEAVQNTPAAGQETEAVPETDGENMPENEPEGEYVPGSGSVPEDELLRELEQLADDVRHGEIEKRCSGPLGGWSDQWFGTSEKDRLDFRVVGSMNGYYLIFHTISYGGEDGMNDYFSAVCYRDGRLCIANDAEGRKMRDRLLRAAVYDRLESICPGCSTTQKINEMRLNEDYGDPFASYWNMEWVAREDLMVFMYSPASICYFWQEENGDIKVVVRYYNNSSEDFEARGTEFYAYEQNLILFDETDPETTVIPANSSMLRVYTVPAERVSTGTEKWGETIAYAWTDPSAYDKGGLVEGLYRELYNMARTAKKNGDYEAFRALFADTDESFIEEFYASDWNYDNMELFVRGSKDGYYWVSSSRYTVESPNGDDWTLTHTDRSDVVGIVNNRLLFVLNGETDAIAAELCLDAIRNRCSELYALMETDTVNKASFFNRNYLWLNYYPAYHQVQTANLIYLCQQKNGDVIAAVWYNNGKFEDTVAVRTQIRVDDVAIGTLFDVTLDEPVNLPAYTSTVYYFTIPANQVVSTQQWSSMDASVDVDYQNP